MSQTAADADDDSAAAPDSEAADDEEAPDIEEDLFAEELRIDGICGVY